MIRENFSPLASQKARAKDNKNHASAKIINQQQ
jgi:hypothetical protein